MVEPIIRGKIGIIVDDICTNTNVNPVGWALFDTEGLPLYSKFEKNEAEFGAMAAIILSIYKRVPQIGGSCYYLPDMDLFLHRLIIREYFFIFILAIEKNIRNHGLVALQIQQNEQRIISILNNKLIGI
ncbi:MAG: hypothetical protein ACFFD2_23080 [Promethearchaeota archaeon]